MVDLKFAPYSFSKLNTYKHCPRKFKYSYIDKIKVPFVYNEALIKGGAVHSILENYPDKSNHKHAEKYNDIAEKFIKSDLGYSILNSDRICEMSFGLTKDLKPCEYKDKNAMFRGFIDCILTSEDGLIIVDYKTGKYKEERWQSYEQLLSYAVYFYMRYENLDKITLSYVYVEHHNACNNLTLERKYLNNYLKTLLTNIKNAESDETFDKNETKLCDWCDYQGHCSKDI